MVKTKSKCNMNKLVYSIIFILPINLLAQIGIGTTTPHESSILEIQSTTRGFLPPRMNYSDIQNIQAPANGLVVYCLDCCGSGNGTIAIRTSSEWTFINKDDPGCSFIADQPMFTDFDLDGVPNTLDLDIDGDGIPNALEAPAVLLTSESNGTFGNTTAGAPKDVDSEVSGYTYGPTGGAEGTYAVISQNSEWHKFDLWDYQGHTDGSGEDAFLAVNGGSAIGTFYSQSIPMIPNVPYTFSFWSRGTSYTIQGRVANADNPSKVLASANQSTGGTLADWAQTTFTYTNTSSKVELFNFSISNLSTASSGNDFAIDDVTAGPTNPSGIKINDYDQDGLTNDYDLDSDGDGIPDNVEYQATAGYIAPGANTDVDGSGVLTAYSTPLPAPINTDGDAFYDFLDPDSDNDGVLDKNENGLTLTGADVDNDGLDDGADADIASSAGSVNGQVVDVSDNVTLPGANTGEGDYRFLDFDGDGELDVNDLDFDNDGILNTVEMSASLLTSETNGSFGSTISGATDVEGDVVGYSYATTNTDEGQYAIINKNITWNASHAALWDYTGHTDGSNTDPFLAVNGGTSMGVFYSQTVSLIPNVQYTFSFWGRGHAFTIQSRLIKDNDISNTPVASAILGTPNTIGWVQRTFTYVNQTNDIELFRFEIGNLSTGAGNDFALDDISAFPTDPNVSISMDHDLDGIPNEYDLDSDGDGIPDNIEAQPTASYVKPTGTYTNGIDDAYGPSGITGLVNTDDDSFPDYLDKDSDNDGESDAAESGLTLTGVDSDKDGLDDGADATVPGRGDVNGLAYDGSSFTITPNASGTERLYRTADYDGDGVNDIVDHDIDNDGILNVDEAGASALTHESNGTFGTTSTPIPMQSAITGYTFANNNTTEGEYAIVSKDCSWHASNIWDFVGHTDGSNTDAFLAINGSTTQGQVLYGQEIALLPNVEYTFKFYTRGQGYTVEGQLFLDSDRSVAVANNSHGSNGLISAWTEVSFTYTNTSSETLLYRFQLVNLSTWAPNDFAIDDITAEPTNLNGLLLHDSDGDGISNEYDLDSDNDGIPDNVEYQTTAGYTAPGANTDVDVNGVPSVYTGGLKNPVNTDGDSYYDFLDTDSDNDNVEDKYETGFTLTGLDSDKDGLDDGADEEVPGHADVNGTAITGSTNTLSGAGPEKDYRFKDFDGDLVEDGVDLDIDNDGILNTDESAISLFYNDNYGTFGTTSTTKAPETDVTAYSYVTNNTAEAQFAVISDASTWHASSLWNYAGHTDGSSTDAYLAVNGATTIKAIYRQKVILQPNVQYTFSYWARGQAFTVQSHLYLDSDNSNTSLGNDIVVHGGIAPDWAEGTFTYTNTSSQAQTYRFEIQNNSTGAGNDFAIDDVNIKPTNAGTIFSIDLDGDGLTNMYDLDSDGDGIPDNVEYQPTAGYSPPGTAVDTEGRLSAYGATGLTTNVDTDGDGVRDYLDSDSDDDNVLDKFETGFTLTGLDVDKDGLDDGADETVPGYGDYNGKAITGSTTNTLPDAGSSGEKAYRFQDTDNDGIANSSDLDIDNDGILNTDETPSALMTQESNGTFGTTSSAVNYQSLGNVDYSYTTNGDVAASMAIISQSVQWHTTQSTWWNYPGNTDGTATDAFIAVHGSTTSYSRFFSKSLVLLPGGTYDFSFHHRGVGYTIRGRLMESGTDLAGSQSANKSTWFEETFTYTNNTSTTKYVTFEIVNLSNNSGSSLNKFAVDDISISFPNSSSIVYDFDNDGLSNEMDLDSDGDGIPDNVEAQTTAGYELPGTAVDAQGRLDAYTATGITNIVDTDGDGIEDYLDNDSDNDGILDKYESGLSLIGTDSDKDGIDDGADQDTTAYGDANGAAINNIDVNILTPDINGGLDKAFRTVTLGNITQSSASAHLGVLNYDGLTITAIESFGSAIEISSDGNTAIVGAARADVTLGSSRNEAGAAYIFRYDGTNWIAQASLTANDALASDHFGNFVTLSSDGDRAFVGVPEDDNTDGSGPGSGSDRGSVYIYDFDGTDWEFTARLTADDGGQSDKFGTSISVNNNGTAFVAGAPGESAAYHFKLDGGTWTQTQKLTASDHLISDKFGKAVDISGDGNTIVIGAHENDHAYNSANGEHKGTAYIFKYSGSTWTEQTIIYPADVGAHDNFGEDVGINYDGTTIVVGSEYDDHSLNAAGTLATNGGSAYIFDFNGSEWLETQQIVSTESAGSDRFGRLVKISDDGLTIGIGNHLDDHSEGSVGGGSSNRGSAILYKKLDNSWIEVKALTAPDANQDDNFGRGFGLNNNGSNLIIGAYLNNPTGNGSGTGQGSIYFVK